MKNKSAKSNEMLPSAGIVMTSVWKSVLSDFHFLTIRKILQMRKARNALPPCPDSMAMPTMDVETTKKSKTFHQDVKYNLGKKAPSFNIASNVKIDVKIKFRIFSAIALSPLSPAVSVMRTIVLTTIVPRMKVSKRQSVTNLKKALRHFCAGGFERKKP